MMCMRHLHDVYLKQNDRHVEYGRSLGGSQTIIDARKRDLDRIQDLFPQDFLGLHLPEPNSAFNGKSKSFRKKSMVDLSQIEASMNQGPCTRMFLMETPCTIAPYQVSVGEKPRHLFLFSDLLVVAKPRSPGTFKLKESIRVSEVWLATCPDSETSFLIGWPSPAKTYLVTFCTQAARDTWWVEIQRVLAAQLQLEPPTTNIRVVYRDPLSGTECSKTLGVGPETSSGDLARLALDENRVGEWAYTLYTRDREGAPLQLIGCERPHSIQLARLRRSLCAEEGFDLQHCNNRTIPSDIVFELKPNMKINQKKSSMKFFRKPSSRFFGVALSRLITNNTLPPVLLAILRVLNHRAPYTQGIFRRCASARALRELKEKIDSQASASCEEISNSPALLLAGLLKDFLRSLPEPLLTGNVQDWLNGVNTGRIENLKKLIMQLPMENHLLLAHVICVLQNIAKKSRFNLMSAANLGICVGPSLLWDSSQNAPLRTLPILIETLIKNCEALFGSQVVSLMAEAGSDSGAEESESIHSLGLSLDSVELSKDQKSLSRDSGLTLSEDDRESPGPNYPFHRSDWARQAARVRVNWPEEEEDDVFCTSDGSACSPPVPPRRPQVVGRAPAHGMVAPPRYRPPPPAYASARLMIVCDDENESYV